MNAQYKELSNSTIAVTLGEKQGKTLLVVAGVHGNEPCGVIACKNIMKTVRIESGKVIWIHANNAALANNVRYLEYNLNRCFRKDQSEQMARSKEGITARELMPYLDEADVLLDIHASYTPESHPFVICNESNLADASYLPANAALTNIDAFHPGPTDAYMNLQKKSALCIECGYLADKEAVTVAEKAILQFLISQGAIAGAVRPIRQKVFRAKSIYLNKSNAFIKSRKFSDFEKVNEKTCIGKDGANEVIVEKDSVLLFVRDVDAPGQECFLTAEEI